MSAETTKTDKVIYILDSEKGILIPYRADYSAAMPYTVSNLNSRKAKPIADKQLGIIIPLTTEHYNSASWAILASLASRYTYVDVRAIVNPSFDERGITGIAGPDQDFANALAGLVNAGVSCFGYINTLGGTKLINDVKNEIDQWRSWFPNLLAGVYFDDAENKDGDRSRSIAYYQELARYAKPGLSILDLADGKPLGQATRDENKGFWLDTEIDCIGIYTHRGYPTDQIYTELKKDWMANLPRSRFFMIPWDLPEDTLPVRNFIDRVVGTEKLAGYIYPINIGIMTNTTRPISTLTEVTMDQLSQLARQGRMTVGNRGIATNEKMPGAADPTDKFLEHKETDRIPEENLAKATQDGDNTRFRTGDKDGIPMIYPTAEGQQGSTWFMDMRNPEKDSKFRNLPNLKKLENGLWTTSTSAKNITLEAWSKKNNKFLNVEITGFFRPRRSDGEYVLEVGARTGHAHIKEPAKWGEASGYKARLFMTGEISGVKQIHYNALTGNRGITQATDKAIIDRYIGMKVIVYNYRVLQSDERDTRKPMPDIQGVAMEIHINHNCTDEIGNLNITSPHWQHIATIRDEPGNAWTAKEAKYTKKKGIGFLEDKFNRLDTNHKEAFRRLDEIITTAGGTGTENCVTWSWYDAVMEFGYLSAREIVVRGAD